MAKKAELKTMRSLRDTAKSREAGMNHRWGAERRGRVGCCPGAIRCNRCCGAGGPSSSSSSSHRPPRGSWDSRGTQHTPLTKTPHFTAAVKSGVTLLSCEVTYTRHDASAGRELG